MLPYSEMSENNYFALLLQMGCGVGRKKKKGRKEKVPLHFLLFWFSDKGYFLYFALYNSVKLFTFS